MRTTGELISARARPATPVLKFTRNLAESLPLLLTDGTTSWVYGPVSVPLKRIDPNDTVLFFHQELGSTRLLTNADRLVVGAAAYDACGQPTGTGIGLVTPFGFAGEYMDVETGFMCVPVTTTLPLRSSSVETR
jgi:hypothetical protein